MTENIDLKPCPFCGSKKITAESLPSLVDLVSEYGKVTCYGCGAYIIGDDIPEHYEELENGLYRKVPMVKGIDAAIEHWNRRSKNVKKMARGLEPSLK